MSISFACPKCSFQLTTKDEHAGRTANCPQCQLPVTVPGKNPTSPTAMVSGPNYTPSSIAQDQMTSKGVSIAFSTEFPIISSTAFENIFVAAKEGAPEDVHYFVAQEGVDINVADEHGNTPLHYAAGWNHNVEAVS